MVVALLLFILEGELDLLGVVLLLLLLVVGVRCGVIWLLILFLEGEDGFVAGDMRGCCCIPDLGGVDDDDDIGDCRMGLDFNGER